MYLHKKLEINFADQSKSEEKQKYDKALHERKQKMKELLNAEDLKQHQREHMLKLRERHSLGELRRQEEQKKTHEIAEWLTKSVVKTKIHKIVEEADTEAKQQAQKAREQKEQLKK